MMENIAQEICEEGRFDICQLWQKALFVMEKRVSKASFETWIKSTKAIHFDNQTLVIKVPNDFAKDWLESRYYNLIKDSLELITNQKISLSFVVSNSKEISTKADQNHSSPVSVKNYDEELVLTYLNPKYTFGTFVVGESNRFAHSTALAAAKSLAKFYNPLFIYGGVGQGKTHLMQAIGHFVMKSDPRAKVVYLSSDEFTNELINAIRDDRTKKFRDKYRNINLLLIDDIQFLAGKERTQEEFLYMFNALYEANKQIIISSNRPPGEIPTLAEGLRSRFKGGVIAKIKPPDFGTRIEILRKRAELENLQIPNNVIDYIANQIHSDIRELDGALTKVIVYSSVKQSQITLDLCIEALKDF